MAIVKIFDLYDVYDNDFSVSRTLLAMLLD